MADDKTTVIKTGGSNLGLIFLAIAILVVAVVGFSIYQNEQKKNDAVTSAASAVGDAAKSVGDAAKQ